MVCGQRECLKRKRACLAGLQPLLKWSGKHSQQSELSTGQRGTGVMRHGMRALPGKPTMLCYTQNSFGRPGQLYCTPFPGGQGLH